MTQPNEPAGPSAGGKARAKSLSPIDRQSIARKAAEARWGGPKATHVGDITIGEMVIPCAVLTTGQRVVSQRGFQRAIGTGNPGKKDASEDTSALLQAKNLQPFISRSLADALREPLVYRVPDVGRGGNLWPVAHGINAKLIPEICDVYLKARDAGALHYKQERLAQQADVLMRGLAVVGIVALIDEVTGYQTERARDELNRILEAYIAEELRQWVRLFPDEFFRQIYRLRGWEYKPGNTKGPRFIGKLINRYIYDQLPPGVPERLRELNPSVNGQRRHKHHQFLTDHTGEPHLDRQITVVTTLMRIARDNDDFEALFRRAYPKLGEQQMMRLPTHGGSEEE